MKLVQFSVTNYRSITTAHEIKMSDLTVLVGKNNEGKSNILKALVLAMDTMKWFARSGKLTIPSRGSRVRYQWEEDYPLPLQEKYPNGNTYVSMSFSMNDAEIGELRQACSITISEYVPIKMTFSRGDIVKIDIPKKGSAAFSDPEKKKTIVDYICGKIDINFIPAVRTSTHSMQAISDIIEEKLIAVSNNVEYKFAVETINRLQQETLDTMSRSLTPSLTAFLPSIREIRLSMKETARRSSFFRDVNIVVDDGIATSIETKGDGVKSIMALAMLNIDRRSGIASIVAIEEPEAHLHPNAARQLCQTIKALSQRSQVILTTHSPVFINRSRITDNIIVDGGKASPAKRLKDMREVLGTIVSDNLINAEYILVVEGEDDKIALEKILPRMNGKIASAISDGILAIDFLGGAGNIVYKLTLLRTLQCQYHILLDNDAAGREASQKAIEYGLATMAEITKTNCNGSPESEIEDCYNLSAYKDDVLRRFGVTLDVPQFRCNKKWSDRVKDCFLSQGKDWNENIEKAVKVIVADALPTDPSLALCQHKRSSIDALAFALCSMIQ